jgi:hypothetical protein
LDAENKQNQKIKKSKIKNQKFKIQKSKIQKFKIQNSKFEINFLIRKYLIWKLVRLSCNTNFLIWQFLVTQKFHKFPNKEICYYIRQVTRNSKIKNSKIQNSKIKNSKIQISKFKNQKFKIQKSKIKNLKIKNQKSKIQNSKKKICTFQPNGTPYGISIWDDPCPKLTMSQIQLGISQIGSGT